jgi:predicted DNA binding CopG/RHH family protein
MVAAIGSRITQAQTTQSAPQVDFKHDIQIAQATLLGKDDSLPFLPHIPTEAQPNTSGVQVFVGGRTYKSEDFIPSVKRFLKEHPMALPSTPPFTFVRPVKPQGEKSIEAVRAENALVLKDQALLANLRKIQANPKAAQAQRKEAQSLVMMAGSGGSGWQNLGKKLLNGLRGLFGKKPPQKPEDDKKVAAPTEQQQAKDSSPSNTTTVEPVKPKSGKKKSQQPQSTGKPKKAKPTGRKQATKKGPGSKSEKTTEPPQATSPEVRLQQAQEEPVNLGRQLEQFKAQANRVSRLLNKNTKVANEGKQNFDKVTRHIEAKDAEIAALEQEITLQNGVSTQLREIKELLKHAKQDGVVAKNTHEVSRLTPEDYARSVEIAQKFEAGQMSVEELRIAETQLKAIKIDLSAVIEYQRLIRTMGNGEAADILRKFFGN